tara:strand:+ start:680 stop:1048 length:369 start_codon:yes stop_codon:yes gene_type:complete
MARTKSSRGVAPFKMRSGNSPLPLFGGFGQAIKKGFNALIGKKPDGPGGKDDLKAKIDEIHAATAGGGGDGDVNVDGVNVDTGGKSKIQAAIDAASGSTDPKVVLAQMLKDKANETGEIPTV